MSNWLTLCMDVNPSKKSLLINSNIYIRFFLYIYLSTLCAPKTIKGHRDRFEGINAVCAPAVPFNPSHSINLDTPLLKKLVENCSLVS